MPSKFRLACLAALLAAAGAAAAQAQPASAGAALTEVSTTDQGFSWFLGLARQQIQYQEFSSRLPVESRARTGSPLLVTGALYAIDRNLLFSLNSESTFLAGSAQETWRATAPVFNGITLTSPVLQTNNFSLSHTDTLMLGHYRLAGDWFVVGGPSVRTLSFKRNSFVIGPDQAVNTPSATTVEESAGEVVLNLGLALESGRVKGAPSHYALRATVGRPVLRRVDNTSFPAARFNGTEGYDAALEGRYSVAVHDAVHLGVWGRWAASLRSAQTQALNGVTYELPRSRLDTVGFGLELLWKL